MNEHSLPAADTEAIGERIAEIAAHMDAATHELLREIRRFDEAAGWCAAGARSCAHWLSWRVGMTLGPAREHVRVAKALGALPRIDDALCSGALSYAKVRAMTRVATAANEESLLDMALRSTAAQIERLCRVYRQVRPASASPDDHRRFIAHRSTEDGMVRVEIQLPPDQAYLVMKAFRAAAGESDLIDGVVALAEEKLRGSVDAPPAVEVQVHMDAATLVGHLEDGTGVPAETCRRLACDAGLVPVIEDEAGKTLDVGRRSRSISAAIRRALLARDQGCCRFPGCANRRWLHGHHIEHWVDGGETKLTNLILLCSRDHRRVHELGYRVVTIDDAVRFLDPRGRVVEPEGVRPRVVAAMGWLRERAGAADLAIDARTNAPGWDGEPVEYERCVDALASLDGY
jgi:hypothetical protein